MQVAPIWKTKRSFKSVFGIKLSILCGGLVMKLCQLWRLCIEDISPLPLGVNFVKSIRRTLYTLFGFVRKFLVYGHPWSGSTKLSRFNLLSFSELLSRFLHCRDEFRAEIFVIDELVFRSSNLAGLGVIVRDNCGAAIGELSMPTSLGRSVA